MTTAALKRKNKKNPAGLKCAQSAGILIVTGVNLQQFNTLTMLSVSFYEHGFSLQYLDLWLLSSTFYICQYANFVYTLLCVSLSISKTLMLL